MKAIAPYFVVIALLSGLTVSSYAQGIQDASPKGGFLPGSWLYRFDITLEEMWQGVLRVSSSANSQIDYLNKRISERQAEKAELIEKGSDITTKEFTEAKTLENYFRREVVDMKEKAGAPDRAEMEELRDGWREELGEKNLTYLAVQKENLRNRLLLALKSGDETALASIKEQYETAKKKYDDASVIMVNFRTADEMEAERIEEMFFEMDRAELVIQRAERQKAEAERLKWNVKSLLQIMDAAKKARDKNDAEALKNLTKNLQKTMRETRIDIERQQAADETKKDLAVEPKPAAAKPVLKKIPSETITKYPLGLMGWDYRFQAKVGTYFETTFDAMGGLPPYYFKLNNGTGFPPLGLILDLNGRLSGIPKAAGVYTFEVCAIDTAGDSDCPRNTMYVTGAEPQEPVVQPTPAPQPAPQPAPLPAPDIAPQFVIASAGCQLTKSAGADSEYTVNVAGTASGPVGARLSLPTLSGYTSESWTSSWGNGNGDVEDRGTSDPETTNWTSTLVVGRGTKTVEGYVRVGSNKVLDKRVLACE